MKFSRSAVQLKLDESYESWTPWDSIVLPTFFWKIEQSIQFEYMCIFKVIMGYLELYDFIYVYIYATETGILKS